MALLGFGVVHDGWRDGRTRVGRREEDRGRTLSGNPGGEGGLAEKKENQGRGKGREDCTGAPVDIENRGGR